MTNIQITPTWPEVKPKGYYVYLHRRATDGSVFYVGKGKGKRGWAKSRSKYWDNIAKKNGVVFELCQDGLSEIDAFTLEMWLIKKERISGSLLANLSGGGEGPSGVVMPSRVRVFSSLGEEFESITIAVDFLKRNGYPLATVSNITSCCKGRMSFAYGRSWSSVSVPDHPDITDSVEVFKANNIERCSKNVYSSTGEKFSSVSEAVSWLSVNGYKSASQGTVSRAAKCGGVSYDRSWSFVELPKHTGLSGFENRYRLIKKPVENCVGLRFNCLADAVDWVQSNGNQKATYHAISKCCNGKQKTAYGYKWRFVDDTDDT